MRKSIAVRNDDEEEKETVSKPQVTIDEGLRTIYIFGDDLDSKVLLDFKKYFETLEKVIAKAGRSKTNRDIKLYLCTNGGNCSAGLAIYDLLRSKSRSGGLRIETIAIGEVGSAGIIIFLAGDKRLIHENTVLISHLTDQDMKNCSRQEKNNIMDQIRVVDVICRNIILKRSKLNSRILTRLEKSEKYITAEEVVKYGLAHEIIKND